MAGAQEGLNSQPRCTVFCNLCRGPLWGVLRAPPFSLQHQPHLSGARPQEGTMAKTAALGSLVLWLFVLLSCLGSLLQASELPGPNWMGVGKGSMRLLNQEDQRFKSGRPGPHHVFLPRSLQWID